MLLPQCRDLFHLVVGQEIVLPETSLGGFHEDLVVAQFWDGIPRHPKTIGFRKNASCVFRSGTGAQGDPGGSQASGVPRAIPWYPRWSMWLAGRRWQSLHRRWVGHPDKKKFLTSGIDIDIKLYHYYSDIT